MLISIEVKLVDFDFRLIEIYNEKYELILILLGRARITVYKDWRIENENRCQAESWVNPSHYAD